MGPAKGFVNSATFTRCGLFSSHTGETKTRLCQSSFVKCSTNTHMYCLYCIEPSPAPLQLFPSPSDNVNRHPSTTVGREKMHAWPPHPATRNMHGVLDFIPLIVCFLQHIHCEAKIRLWPRGVVGLKHGMCLSGDSNYFEVMLQNLFG